MGIGHSAGAAARQLRRCHSPSSGWHGRRPACHGPAYQEPAYQAAAARPVVPEHGVAFLPMMPVGAALTPVSAHLAERVGARLLVTGGLVLMAAGLVLKPRGTLRDPWHPHRSES